MRLRLILCLGILASATNAFALKPASDDAKIKIREQIALAATMDKDVFAAQSLLDKTNENSPDYPGLLRNLIREKDKQCAAYTKAIRMTLKAYDLEPQPLRGISVMPWTKGRQLSWVPVANIDPTRELQNPNGDRRESTRTPLDWAGRTFTDGVTYINHETLRLGPDFLASTLLHERTHFELFTTHGRGDSMSTAETEVVAYQIEKSNVDIFFGEEYLPSGKRNPIRENALNHIETLKAQEQTKVDEAHAAKQGFAGIVNRLFPPKPNPDFSDAKLHTPDELAALKKQSAAFDEELIQAEHELIAKAKEDAEQASRDEAQRRFREALTGRAQEEEYSRVAEETRRGSLVQPQDGPVVIQPIEDGQLELLEIRSIATNACGSPPNVTDEMLSSISWSRLKNAENPTMLSIGLSECEARVLQRLVQFGRSWTDGAAIRATEILAIAAAPQAAAIYGGSNRTGGSASTTPPPTAHHDPNGEALEQLKREEDAARRKRWGLPPRRN